MGKKLESVWEGSRFLLPEHVQLLRQEMQEQGRRSRPAIDPDEWELIDQALGYALLEKEQITIVLFDPYKDLKVRGVVVKVDRQLRRIKFQMEEDFSWIKIDDVIRVIT
ncbi:YolD-like family protein [Paenibacillus borealis]|uniref:YolD-like family protein n=1 Tax=Paenibacillus borealis TaxID=160799 RepID=A0A089MT75_PAEBO|nr:YolD-like family protein [Paenibacillus borealis]AIQ59664.1 hypothetical protein PBOR_23925 [Paenibacillus borealis]